MQVSAYAIALKYLRHITLQATVMRCLKKSVVLPGTTLSEVLIISRISTRFADRDLADFESTLKAIPVCKPTH
jgi:hypothetical protein